MNRRQLIQLSAAPLARAFAAPPLHTVFDRYFLEILEGFLGNARRTSDSFAVCDFPGGTILKGCVARSGKTYVSVARMMPAMAAWYAAGRQPSHVGGLDLGDVLKRSFRNAFDPRHPDYWEEPPIDRASQRQVEACLVAWALWMLGDGFIGSLEARDRANIQAWLASCTRFPERKNNHAWFHAINNAARLALSEKWKEFQGDEAYMKADVKALDGLGSAGDGWYSDSPDMPIFDYYNFFTFASHFLVWNQIAGSRYPELARPFIERLRLFLDKAPYFFAAHGGHALFGRSLIYRWAVLMPLVLAYRQNLWPHSPGLLRRIVRGNLEYHWNLGAYDRQRGKLRETFSAEGTPHLREAYVDNGHPYWAMLSFPFLAIAPRDPFWTAPEEPLPVERADFTMRFAGPRFLLAGSKASGQVRWIQSQNNHYRAYYRDRYIKFSYSSHFPFNIGKSDDRCPVDAALIFRNPQTGKMAARSVVERGELTGDGVRVVWRADLDGRTVTVTSTIRVAGEFEARRHEISGAAGLEAVEGSAALGLGAAEQPSRAGGILRAPASGYCVATWPEPAGVEIAAGTNVVYARSAVNTRTTVCGERTVLRSVHYASPKPLSDAAIRRRAQELFEAL